MRADVKHAFEIAYYEASLSVDPNTQVGAVLELEDGTIIKDNNHPTKGISIHELSDSGKKSQFMAHAETAVLLKAARRGVSTVGSTMYAPWSACCDCARAIVEAGVSVVYRHVDAMAQTPDRWQASIQFGDLILYRAGVAVIEEEGEIGATPIIMSGNLWKP